jgi:hypothetical protein
MQNRLNILLLLVVGAVVLAGCSTPERSVKQAEQALSRGEYEAAATHFKKAYQRTSPKMRRERGILAYRMAEAYRKFGNVAR